MTESERCQRDKFSFLYTNADQFINKRDELGLLIAGNQPDVICITEVIPKAQALPIGPSQLAIPDYAQYCNFDPSLANLGTSGKRGVCIFVAQHIQVSEVCFPYDGCEHLWLRTNLCGGDVLHIGGVYRSPSADVLSTSNLCNLITVKRGYKGQRSYKGQILGKSLEGPG